MNDGETRIHHLDADAWAQLPAQPQVPVEPEQRAGRWRSIAVGIALVLVGAVVGTVGVTALQHRSGSAAAQNVGAAAVTRDDALPEAAAPNGGVAGEQRVVGTVTAVAATTVTVRTSSGSAATYAVDGSTDIRRDGRRIALSGLTVGESVLVHVIPKGSQSYAERILAGRTGDGFGGPDDGATDDRPV